MGLSLLCVFFTTLLLIQNVPVCLLVLACVLLTIEVVSTVNLVIAVGLCVDYSAHIAHNFLGQSGSGRERAVATLADIGPAVLNGGFSTFLAFVLTASSTSHVFATFFKIFFLVSLFGMFHALIFLPVILSLFGCCLQPHQSSDTSGLEKA